MRHPQALSRLGSGTWKAKDGKRWGRAVDVIVRDDGVDRADTGRAHHYSVQLVLAVKGRREKSARHTFSYLPKARGHQRHARRSSWDPQAVIAPLLRVDRSGRVLMKAREQKVRTEHFEAVLTRIRAVRRLRQHATGRWPHRLRITFRVKDVYTPGYKLKVKGKYETLKKGDDYSLDVTLTLDR